ncbi:FecR family protein [Pedobacter sp.]
MENQKHTLSQLYQDFLDNRTSPEQSEQLKELFGSGDEDVLRMLVSQALKNVQTGLPAPLDEQQRLDNIYGRISSEIGGEKPRKKKPILQLNYAIISAAAISLLILGTLLYLNRHNNISKQQTALAFSDVPPGSDKAILILSDGRKVSLNGTPDGELNEQVPVSRTADGLVYGPSTNPAASQKYNTVQTPNGGQYRVVLPDGTKVWLNAASSLKYPISFGAFRERRVELVGEAYFEVAHNRVLPFRVVSRGQTVEVLGTHFNVNSYGDEKATATTLEEGSVRVIAGATATVIEPGEQAVLDPEGKISVRDADMRSALAWKDGKIIFRDADIRSIMRQVSRWYDLEIVYAGKVPDRTFNGGVERTANLSSLLKILELNDIRFQLVSEGGKKKLIVQ